MISSINTSKGSNKDKGENGGRSNVCGSGKGGTFTTPKIKHNGHH